MNLTPFSLPLTLWGNPFALSEPQLRTWSFQLETLILFRSPLVMGSTEKRFDMILPDLKIQPFPCSSYARYAHSTRTGENSFTGRMWHQLTRGVYDEK